MTGTLHCNRCHLSVQLIDDRAHTKCPSCNSPYFQIYASKSDKNSIKKDLNSTQVNNRYDFKEGDNQTVERGDMKMKNSQKQELGEKVLEFIDGLDEKLTDKDKRKVLSVPYKLLASRISKTSKKPAKASSK